MTKSRLVACPRCSRHVRVDEAACPFCEGALPVSFGGGSRPSSPAARLSRAALYAFGVGTLSVTAACGGETGTDVKDGGGGDAMLTADTSSIPDTGNYAVPYGVPADAYYPPADAGSPGDSAAPADATTTDTNGVAPPYGAPPPPPEDGGTD